MSVGKFMKSGGIAALAAGLAFVALPASASAQERDHGWRGRDGGGQQQQQQQQAQPQQRGGGEGRWSGGENRGAENRGAENRVGGNWNRPQVQQQAPAPMQQAPRQEANRGGGWRGGPAQGEAQIQQRWQQQRNPAYADQQRDRTYNRDGNRDAQRGWQRDGNRDGQRNWQREGNRDGQRNWQREGNRDWQRDGQRSGGNWARTWRNDNRYDWRDWRSSHRETFRMPRYYAPYRDWSYRRLSIGFFLEPLFFSENYWIDDPYMYRLPPAYGPFRWVRYYDDALLVNIYTGEVEDVLYDFFW